MLKKKRRPIKDVSRVRCVKGFLLEVLNVLSRDNPQSLQIFKQSFTGAYLKKQTKTSYIYVYFFFLLFFYHCAVFCNGVVIATAGRSTDNQLLISGFNLCVINKQYCDNCLMSIYVTRLPMQNGNMSKRFSHITIVLVIYVSGRGL